MGKTLTIGALLAFLLIPSAVPAADPEVPNERKWGLGWDEGLTLRRWIGSWELGVAAGPNDWLTERDTRQWSTEEPDSLQGRDYRSTSTHRESGFVRLQAGRKVAGQGPVHFMAQSSLQYRWQDERRETAWYYEDYDDLDTTDFWEEAWTLSLGLRLAWRPLDALSIETTFGLYYSWEDWEEVHTDIRRDRIPPLDPDRVVVRQTKGSDRSFDDRGWYGLGHLSFIYWF